MVVSRAITANQAMAGVCEGRTETYVSGTAIVLERLDHLVLTVRDVPATCDFYRRVLGMEVVTFGAGRKALRFGRQKINLHQAGKDDSSQRRGCRHRARPTCAWSSTHRLGPGQSRVCASFGVDVLDGPVGAHRRARQHRVGLYSRPGRKSHRALPIRLSAQKASRARSSTQAIRSRLVVPEIPKGMPAMIAMG